MNDRDARPPNAAPPQFGLRTMFIVIAGLSGWFAVGVWLGPCGLVLVPVVAWFIAWLARLDPQQRQSAFVVVLIVGCGVAPLLLVPTGPTRSAARRSQCSNNLKQIGLALQSYHDTYECFPPAFVVDASGKPMHSWRVLLLPFLEQGNLYTRYDFDEPWNGPNNRLLAKEVIDIFHCPSDSRSKLGETSYVAVVGPETAWPGAECVKLGDITDGIAFTVLVVEVANSGIHWMEPRDLDVSSLKWGINSGRRPAISSLHSEGAQALVVDGSVGMLPEWLNGEMLEPSFTRNGGEETDEL